MTGKAAESAMRAVISLSLPMHLRRLIGKSADRTGRTLSRTVAAIIAEHYGVELDGNGKPFEPSVKRKGKSKGK
jgi:hypothetical protein